MGEYLPDTNVGNIEYISKQDAVDAFNRAVQDVGILDADDIETVFGMLSPADVVEVKHGEWMSVPETWGAFDIRYYCSECGKDAIINNNERYVLSDYCPHCGAIMDNKRGNKNG